MIFIKSKRKKNFSIISIYWNRKNKNINSKINYKNSNNNITNNKNNRYFNKKTIIILNYLSHLLHYYIKMDRFRNWIMWNYNPSQKYQIILQIIIISRMIKNSLILIHNIKISYYKYMIIMIYIIIQVIKEVKKRFDRSTIFKLT